VPQAHKLAFSIFIHKFDTLITLSTFFNISKRSYRVTLLLAKKFKKYVNYKFKITIKNWTEVKTQVNIWTESVIINNNEVVKERRNSTKNAQSTRKESTTSKVEFRSAYITIINVEGVLSTYRRLHYRRLVSLIPFYLLF